MKYRPDIDGLRAIAILAVVLFHAKVPGFGGGFVGVDIFFVISGFLITTLLVGEHHRGGRALLNFYARRALRILPILCFVLTVVAVAGFILLPDFQCQYLGKSILYGSLFGKNISVYREPLSYFSPYSELDPLLHLWSLSIEEQIYLVYPLFLLTLLTFRGKRTWLFSALFMTASFIAAELALGTDGKSAFYFAQYRAGEFLIGGCLALSPLPAAQRWQEELGSFVGLGLLAFSIGTFSFRTRFPGVSSLVPCMGAALLIWGGRSSSGLPNRINRQLAKPLPVFFGLISYSLYLWHWPILVFTKLTYWRPLTLGQRLALLGLSVLISFASWRIIERPFRSLSGNKRWVGTLSAVGFSVLVGLVGYTLQKRDSWLAARQAAIPGNSLTRERPIYPEHDGEFVSLASEESPQVLLWGDSHAQALADGVGTWAKKDRVPTTLFANQGCPPFVGTNSFVSQSQRKCGDVERQVLQYLDAHPSIREVILAARWAIYADGTMSLTDPRLQVRICYEGRCPASAVESQDNFQKAFHRTLDALTVRGKRITVVGPIPEMEALVLNVMRATSVLGLELPTLVTSEHFHERQRTVLPFLKTLDQYDNVRVVYPHKVLCRATCEYALDGAPLYYDDSHLEPSAAIYLWQKLNERNDLSLH